MPQISLKVNGNGTLTIKDQNTATPPLSNDGLLKSYAPLASPALTGAPTAPTTNIYDASMRIATTEFVGWKINNVQSDAVTLTGAQEITGAKTFKNNSSTTIQNNDGDVKFEVKNTQIEISGPIKPLDMDFGIVRKDLGSGALVAGSIMTDDIADSAVTLTKIDSSIYSVANTPNTLVKRDLSGNMPANNNWTGNNAFSPSQFFIGGTVDAPIYKPFSSTILTDSSGIVLGATNLFGLYLCNSQNNITINLPSMTENMIGIKITFINISTSNTVTIQPSFVVPLGQIFSKSNQTVAVAPTLDNTNNTVTIIAGKIDQLNGAGIWYII